MIRGESISCGGVGGLLCDERVAGARGDGWNGWNGWGGLREGEIGVEIG